MPDDRTEAEIRADEIEHILTHILTGPRSPATNALERRLAELRDVDLTWRGVPEPKDEFQWFDESDGRWYDFDEKALPFWRSVKWRHRTVDHQDQCSPWSARDA